MIAEKPSWIRHEGMQIFSIDIQPGGLRFATGGGDHKVGLFSSLSYFNCLFCLNLFLFICVCFLRRIGEREETKSWNVVFFLIIEYSNLIVLILVLD